MPGPARIHFDATERDCELLRVALDTMAPRTRAEQQHIVELEHLLTDAINSLCPDCGSALTDTTEADGAPTYCDTCDREAAPPASPDAWTRAGYLANALAHVRAASSALRSNRHSAFANALAEHLDSVATTLVDWHDEAIAEHLKCVAMKDRA